MKKQLLTLFTIAIAASALNAQQIHNSEAYTISGSEVRQGDFTAKAVSDTEIHSNYRNINSRYQSNTLAVRFLVNGNDCEFPLGDAHYLTIEPLKGEYTTQIMKFGKPDFIPVANAGYLPAATKVTFRLDMSEVLSQIKNSRSYTTNTGEVLTQIASIYLVGTANTSLKNKHFHAIDRHRHCELKDVDGDGVYEVELELSSLLNYMKSDRWQAKSVPSRYPLFESDYPLMNALYGMAIEEMNDNIEADSTLRTGALWGGVWTRDVSYSIYLAYAGINARVSQISLMNKVTPHGRIVQDTGSGGAWPVSTDRVVWSIAAWEIYKNTGDSEWLNTIYRVIKNTVEDDMKVVFNPEYGLMMGETSFVDWRAEQSYPFWMDSKDIYMSMALGTNVLHYQTLRILCEIAQIKGDDYLIYEQRAAELKKAINKWFWMENQGQFGEYIYGLGNMTLSPRLETLGSSLAVLFDIIDGVKASDLIASYPVTPFGTTVLYPQMPFLPPYHNNGIWPFVQAYWNLAAAKVGNEEALTFGIASIFRASTLFLSNFENFVAESGDFQGTEINSNRMLWSIAGNLAMYYRVFFGINVETDRLDFKPLVPAFLKGEKRLKGYPYGDALLDITVKGTGNKITSFKVDGKRSNDYSIPAGLQGSHTIEITMGGRLAKGSVNLSENYFMPVSPVIHKVTGENRIEWSPTPNAARYIVYRNGTEIAQTTSPNFDMGKTESYNEYQVKSVDANGVESYLSNPIVTTSAGGVSIFEAENISGTDRADFPFKNHSGLGFIELSKDINTSLKFEITTPKSGEYLIDLRYSNGEGPINTENKCAIRSLYVNGDYVGSIIMPQRGTNLWSDWGFSSLIKSNLQGGINTIEVKLEAWNENMNVKVNRAMVDYIRFTQTEN